MATKVNSAGGTICATLPTLHTGPRYASGSEFHTNQDRGGGIVVGGRFGHREEHLLVGEGGKGVDQGREREEWQKRSLLYSILPSGFCYITQGFVPATELSQI